MRGARPGQRGGGSSRSTDRNEVAAARRRPHLVLRCASHLNGYRHNAQRCAADSIAVLSRMDLSGCVHTADFLIIRILLRRQLSRLSSVCQLPRQHPSDYVKWPCSFIAIASLIISNDLLPSKLRTGTVRTSEVR